MPILVPAIGVHGKPWMHLLVDVFQGLRLPVDGAIDGPVLPAPRDCRGEEFSCRAIESGEVAAFLRTFLGLPAPVAGERNVSSHSLKATCLSRVSKYGVSDRTQAVLGRHCKCASTADAVYARDLGVGPTRELQRIIEAIAEGDFRPDEARSRYFRFPPRPPSPASEVTENQCEAAAGVPSARQSWRRVRPASRRRLLRWAPRVVTASRTASLPPRPKTAAAAAVMKRICPGQLRPNACTGVHQRMQKLRFGECIAGLRCCIW